MAKSLVGKMKNQSFAFFWLLIGGGIANLLLLLGAHAFWLVFLPPAILSLVIAVAIVNRKQRPKIWLGLDLLLTFILLIFFVPPFLTNPIRLAISLPGILIILGCILAIMNW
jgi:hypothetical protein